METSERKQRQPEVALNEAAVWYLRSNANRLSRGERREFAKWLRHSPDHISALLLIRAVVRRAIPRLRHASWLEQFLTRVMRPSGERKRVSAKLLAISFSYLDHVKRQHRFPKIALLGVVLCGVVGWFFLQDVRPLKVAAVSFVCLSLLMVREAAIRYRVAHGYFGSSESEVRDFVKFITAHRSDIDFTDRRGKRRPSLVPEPQHRDPVTSEVPGRVLSE